MWKKCLPFPCKFGPLLSGTYATAQYEISIGGYALIDKSLEIKCHHYSRPLGLCWSQVQRPAPVPDNSTTLTPLMIDEGVPMIDHRHQRIVIPDRPDAAASRD
jgi:hypothetical protein